MSLDISNLLKRLTLIENDLTPVAVRQGLNPQQKSADQLPALFQPKKIRALGSRTDPQHPMRGKMVGDDVQINMAQTALEEVMGSVEEIMLEKVRQDLNSYLDALKDTTKLDRRLVSKAKQSIGADESAVSEDPTQSEPSPSYVPEPTINPVMPESAVIEVAMQDGRSCEIYGDQDRGFEVGHDGRRIKTRFATLEQATMAVEMYKRRSAASTQNPDYLDEA
jgi:hypothetical protein